MRVREILVVISLLVSFLPRLAAAGDVQMITKRQYPGILFFYGSDGIDRLTFTPSGAGYVHVRATIGTTINGQGGIRFKQEYNEININGFGGLDEVGVSGLTFPGRFSFSGGDGNDSFTVFNSTLGEVLWDAETGIKDTFYASASSFDRLSLAALSTNQSSSSVLQCKIQRELLVRGGSGADYFAMSGTAITGSASINLGDGLKPALNEAVLIDSSEFTGRLNIEVGNSASEVNLAKGRAKSLRVLMGSADGDLVHLEQFNAGDAEISGGAGIKDVFETPRSTITTKTVRDFEIIR